jgi:hypothetical protein
MASAMRALFLEDVVIFMEVEELVEVISDNYSMQMAAAVQRRALLEFQAAFFQVGLGLRI